MEKTAPCGGGSGGDDPTDPLLPEDLLIQILVRLPIKSLLRFMSVSKSWRDLIQSSFFNDLHTTFNSSSTSSSSNFGTFILRTENLSNENFILMISEYEGETENHSDCSSSSSYRCTDGSWHKFTDGVVVDDSYGGGHGYWLWDDTNGRWYWYWVSGDDAKEEEEEEVSKVDDDDDDQLLLIKVDKLELPSWYNLTYSRVIAGSCNGLICLYDQKLRDVSLWNPATGQFRTLPKPITIEINDDDSVEQDGDFVAFGFDVTTKDYKVLLLPYFISKNRAQWPIKIFCRAQVYSLSTDCWREINSTVALPAEGHGLYLNGSCFFLANVYHPESNTSSRFISSFDFSKEIFTTMQLPDHDQRKRFFLRYLGGEKMALFTTLRKRPSDEYDSDCSNDSFGYEDCDNWVLNEQQSGDSLNKEECWTKLHSFQIRNNKDGQPIGMSNNGKFAFLDTTDNSYGRRIQLYNLATKEVKLDIPFCVSMSKVYVYKPSLVRISS